MSTSPSRIVHTHVRTRTVLRAVTIGAMVTATAVVGLPAHAASSTVTVNEVYGGGGNSGATLKNDFVELYNGSSAAVDLAGWKVLYYSAGGNLGNTCTLAAGASIKPGGYFLIQQAAGSGGTAALPTPDATCTAAMSATAGSVALTAPDGTVVDLVGFGSGTSKVEGAAAPAGSNANSVARKTPGADTDDNAADFAAGAPTPQGSGTTTTPPTGPTNPPTTPTGSTVSIADIQGTGADSPLVGKTVTTKGVVTASYPTGGFNGFYVQTPGSGGTPKTAGQASDGIFVYTSSAPTAKVGDCYTVTGTVTEFNGLTELTSPQLATASDCAPVKPTPLAAPPATDADKEPYEGMLVLPQGQYTITNNYSLNQFGQLGLAVGTDPLWTPTDRVAPAQAAAYEAEQVKKYITLDDGSSWNFMTSDTAKKSPLPYLSQATPMRTDSQVSFTAPVILDYRFQWNYQPTTQVVGANAPFLASENDRPTAPPAVGGDLKIGSMNVLNYFTDLGQNESGCQAFKDMNGQPVAADGCTVRGAYTPAAFADQQSKIVAALATMNADVVALMEIENAKPFGHDRDYALANLTAALNAKVGAGTYGYVPSPQVVPGTEDVIRTAFIYKTAKVQPVDSSAILIDPAFANARQPLGQKFAAAGSTATFTVVANHFKSKGSGADDGTGQGLSNPSREAQARALTDWVRTMWPDQPVFLMGDFNAYSEETPAKIIKDAGYTDLVREANPHATSYQFGGRLGSLDHAYANAPAKALVTGADDFNINADESVAMQYSRRHYNVVDFYEPTMYAASDHDPVLVGIKAPAGPAVPVTNPALTPYQTCTSFGVKIKDFQAGDQIRIDGTWGGQKQTTTVAATATGWWSGEKPTWADASAVVIRGGRPIESTRVAITQKPECVAKVTSYQSATSFGFKVAPYQPGDKLRIDGTWGGQKQTTTVDVTDAGWFSGEKPGWTDATAVVVRGGQALESTRVRITNTGS